MKRELLDNGNIWQKSDGRWIGLVRYKDEFGVTQRKSFSSKKRVYKFPEVERTTYDRYECTAEHQIYPYIGNKPVGDVTPADIKKLLTKHMNAGYAFTTSKKAYSLLKMFFKQLYQEGAIPNNPMALIDMTKKDNYLAAQNKESKPQCDLVVVFTDEELELIREEAFKRFSNGKPVYQQSAAYFLMLNTGIHLQRGVKEVHVRDGLEYVAKLEVKVGKLKSKTSKRDVPLNDTAVEMIQRLREEVYLGEDKPLIPDENGNFTNPRNMRNRFYRILDAIVVPHKGLHTFRHTFATRLINGVKQPDGSVKSLSVKQVAELLGHTTSEITELYYVKRDTTRLVGLTDSFNL